MVEIFYLFTICSRYSRVQLALKRQLICVRPCQLGFLTSSCSIWYNICVFFTLPIWSILYTEALELCFVFSCTQPFLEAASLWSRVAITEQAVAANLPPGFLTSPHVIVPDLEYSLKVRQYKTPAKSTSHSLLFPFKTKDKNRRVSWKSSPERKLYVWRSIIIILFTALTDNLN